MAHSLAEYEPIVGAARVDEIRTMGRYLEGLSLLQVNSTAVGGGVAEILSRMVPLMEELGIRTSWEVLAGDQAFYGTTKSMHNGLQGQSVDISPGEFDHYMEVNYLNAQRLHLDSDVVIVHDPQPAALVNSRRDGSGCWIWRCHVDVSMPYRPLWKFLAPIVSRYDASVWSMPQFTRGLPHDQFIVHPSIDPLADKNRELEGGEISAVHDRLGIPRDLPIVLQVSRFDRFKDPVGVIRAWRLASRHVRSRLVLAGGAATDDPEGLAVLEEVREAARDDTLIHVLMLPPTFHVEINALQRGASVVLQKSTREGFGLTVAEAMWKGKPVIGGATGGIAVQVIDGVTGYLVHSIEGTAYRIRQLLSQPRRAARMGKRGRELVRERFLLTRHVRDYLALILAVRSGRRDTINL